MKCDFARAERAVEIAGRAAAPLDAAANEPERIIEREHQLGRDNVVLDRLRGRLFGHALRQLEDEIVGLDPFGDVDQVAEQGTVVMSRPSGRARDAPARAASRLAVRRASGRARAPLPRHSP